MGAATKRQAKKARPFLKWAGGKRQLLPQIDVLLPEALKSGQMQRYVEPFVGSGAVLFHIVQNYPVPESVIADLNPELIRTYYTVQQGVEALIDHLSAIEDTYLSLPESQREPFFYEQRQAFNASRPAETDGVIRVAPQRTAQLIFLNRTCYNGLFRVNASGAFNVPFGRYARPRICDATNLRAVSAALEATVIHHGHYSECAPFIDHDSFVYFDPPYRPLSATANFTAYSQHNFGDQAQLELAQFYRRMDQTGARLLLSNSDPRNADAEDDFFEQAYAGYNIHRVQASRRINSRAEKRGPISELLIANY